MRLWNNCDKLLLTVMEIMNVTSFRSNVAIFRSNVLITGHLSAMSLVPEHREVDCTMNSNFRI